MRNKLLLSLVVILTSLSSIVLLESPIKYILFFIQISIVVFIYQVMIHVGINEFYEFNSYTRYIPDLIFLIVSGTLIVNYFLFLPTILSLVCSILVIFFLPGFSVLRIIIFRPRYTWIEWVVLAFAISIPISTIAFVIFMYLQTHSALLLSSSYFLLSSFSLMTHYSRNSKNENCEIVVINFKILKLMFSTLSYFFVSIIVLYPQMTFVAGLDIARHFSKAQLFILAPGDFDSLYTGFHAMMAGVLLLSLASKELLLTTLAFLSVIIILAFYVMVTSLTRQIDTRMPIIATSIFTCFSGLGWTAFWNVLYFFASPEDRLNLYGYLYNVTYGDIGSGSSLWTWLWFRPMTIAFTLLFAFFYLLTRVDLNRKILVLLTGLISLALGLAHFPELVLLATIIFVLNFLIRQKRELRFKDTSLGFFIGTVGFILFSWLTNQFDYSVQYITIAISIGLIGLGFISYALNYRWQFAKIWSISYFDSRILRIAASLILAVFLGAFLTWLASPQIYSIARFASLQHISIIIFPSLAGIAGIMTIMNYIKLEPKYSNTNLAMMVLTLVATICFGEMIGLFGLANGYGERRIMPMIFACLSIGASAFVIFQIHQYNFRAPLLGISIVSLIVMAGMISSNMTIDFWYLSLPNERNVDRDLAVEFMSLPTTRAANTPILSLSNSSKLDAELIPSTYIIDRFRYPLWNCRYLETPTTILQESPFGIPYAFLSSIDFQLIMDYYQSSYLASHSMRFWKEIFSNQEYTCYEIPSFTPPKSMANISVIFTEERDESYLYICDLLSFGNIEYTTCIESDWTTISNSRIVIFPSDNQNALNIVQNLISLPGDRTVVIFNIGGSGPLSSLFATSDNIEITATKIERDGSTIEFPQPIQVQSQYPNTQSDVLAWYSNDMDEIPFVIKTSNQTTELQYVFLNSIINHEFRDSIYDSSLILSYDFSEIINNSVQDQSSFDNHGILNNTKIMLGALGPITNFNGFDSIIEVNDSESLSMMNAISIEAWVRVDNPDEGFTILSKKFSYDSVDGYSFLYDGSGFYLNFGNGSNYFDNRVSYAGITTDVWHHIVTTYDQQEVRYYFDGIEVGSVNRTETIAANDLPLLLGVRHDGNWPLSGQMTKIKIYNHILDSLEIEEHYLREVSVFWNPISVGPIIEQCLSILDISSNENTTGKLDLYEGQIAFFKVGKFEGTVSIESLSFPSLLTDENIDITIFTDSGIYSFSNIDEISTNCSDYLEVQSSKVTLTQGHGYYGVLSLEDAIIHLSNKPIKLTLENESMSISITIDNGSIFLEGETSLLARTPVNFNIEGTLAFEKLDTLYTLHSTLPSIGNDIVISGTAQFVLVASDTYSFVTDFQFRGQNIPQNGVSIFDEIDLLLDILPLSILMIIPVSMWYNPWFKTKFWHEIFRKLNRHIDNKIGVH